MSRVVGLTGFAGAGKDAVGRVLCDQYGYRRVSFADKLRESMYRLDPAVPVMGNWTTLQTLVDCMGWDQAKRDVPEVRRLLQVFGTEVGRNLIDQNLWVDLALRDVQPGESIVVTDVRFPNEYEAIRSRGGVVVRVTRPGVEAVNGHVSEQLLPHNDVIANAGTLTDLEYIVAAFMRRITPVKV